MRVFRTLIEGASRSTPTADATGLQVIVTVGAENDPAALGPQPAHVHVQRFIPQESLLPYCSAVVTHAGAGSILGALAFGVPLLAVPRGADQFYNAERVVSAGAGLSLLPEQLEPGAVATQLERVLREPAFRVAAQRIEAEIRALPSAEQAVATLEGLVAETRAQAE